LMQLHYLCAPLRYFATPHIDDAPHAASATAGYMLLRLSLYITPAATCRCFHHLAIIFRFLPCATRRHEHYVAAICQEIYADISPLHNSYATSPCGAIDTIRRLSHLMPSIERRRCRRRRRCLLRDASSMPLISIASERHALD